MRTKNDSSPDQGNEKTYINLLRGFYNLGIPHDLSPSIVSAFHAILYRANELRFPSRIKISNTEICGNAGELKRNSLLSVRQRLCEYRYNEQALVIYEPEGNQRAGWYSINYDLLLTVNHSLVTVQSQFNHSLVTVQSQFNHSLVTGNSQNSDETMTEVGLNSDETMNTPPVFRADLRSDQIRSEKENNRLDQNREDQTRKDSLPAEKFLQNLINPTDELPSVVTEFSQSINELDGISEETKNKLRKSKHFNDRR